MKLQAKDLRIGNYVGLSDSNWNDVITDFMEFLTQDEINSIISNNRYAIVSSLSKEVELTAYECDLDFYEFDEIEPIPLTEDWLLRFGFDYFNNDNECKLNFNGFEIYYNDKEGMYLESIGIEVIYVHQLQNLYFALTGTELKLTP